MAESFVDTFKTELIKDRVWHSNSQLELAVIEWVAGYNNDRLHSRLGNRPPAEIEAAFAATAKKRRLAHSLLARTAPTEPDDEHLAAGLSAAK